MEEIVARSGTMLAHHAVLLTPSNSSAIALLPFSNYTTSVTTFKINTYKSLSKQGTLTRFRINTYKKHREGVARILSILKGCTE
jgi:hypothetical protein